MKMPKKILLFVCEHDSDGTPFFAAVTKLSELPDECEGDTIGQYELITESKLTVTRELKL